MGKDLNQPRPRVFRPDCLRGHPLVGANLYVNPRGQRICRTCGREKAQRQRAERARHGLTAAGTVPKRRSSHGVT